MKIKPTHIVLGLALVAVVILFLIQRSLARELFIVRQNNAALVDSVRIEQNKAGELESVKLVLVGDKERLRTLNEELVEELEKERGRVVTITKFETVIERDTVQVPTKVIELPDSSFRLAWSHRDSTDGGSRRLEGNSSFRLASQTFSDVATEITKDEMRLILVTGLRQRDEDKFYEIFVRTAYPGVSFPQIEGAIVDIDMFRSRSKKRWSIGPVLSAGVNQDLKPGIHVGIGVQYGVFRF